MSDDVSRDIFAFIDQEKEKTSFSNEDSDWRDQSKSVSDWLVASYGYKWPFIYVTAKCHLETATFLLLLSITTGVP